MCRILVSITYAYQGLDSIFGYGYGTDIKC
jgi:hypothetical protein